MVIWKTSSHLTTAGKQRNTRRVTKLSADCQTSEINFLNILKKSNGHDKKEKIYTCIHSNCTLKMAEKNWKSSLTKRKGNSDKVERYCITQMALNLTRIPVDKMCFYYISGYWKWSGENLRYLKIVNVSKVLVYDFFRPV